MAFFFRRLELLLLISIVSSGSAFFFRMLELLLLIVIVSTGPAFFFLMLELLLRIVIVSTGSERDFDLPLTGSSCDLISSTLSSLSISMYFLLACLSSS